jgi:hypothetical protein
MVKTAFMCPDGVWPQSLSGAIVAGITAALEDVTNAPSEQAGTPRDDKNTLWVVFDVVTGITAAVLVHLSMSKEMPLEIHELDPVIPAVAARPVWELVISDWETFTKRVAENAVQVSGNYREFGRYTPTLLRALRATDIWDHIGTLPRIAQDQQ